MSAVVIDGVFFIDIISTTALCYCGTKNASQHSFQNIAEEIMQLGFAMIHDKISVCLLLLLLLFAVIAPIILHEFIITKET